MADLYTIWANKEGNISDLEWVNGMKSFFDHLISEGRMESYRITRCKMGFRSIADMPEWMHAIATDGEDVAPEVHEDVLDAMLLRDGDDLVHSVLFAEAAKVEPHAFARQEDFPRLAMHIVPVGK